MGPVGLWCNCGSGDWVTCNPTSLYTTYEVLLELYTVVCDMLMVVVGTLTMAIRIGVRGEEESV